MTTYYVSPNGSNANNGLGPDASHATNKPWLTLAKVMHAGSSVVPGDTVYFGPGWYYSSAVTPIAGLGSTASPTAWRGDPQNLQGFKDGSGVLLPPALVWLTTRTSTGSEEETTSATSLFSMTTNVNKGFQFYDLCLESGRGRIAVMGGANNLDILFQDCRMVAGNSTIYSGTSGFVAAQNLTFRRCIMIASQLVFESLSTVAAGTADADTNIRFEHCRLHGRASLQLSASGGNIAGGVDFVGCLFYNSGAGAAVISIASKVSTVAPCTMEGCLVIGGPMLNAGTSGQLVDNGYNRGIANSGGNTNTTQAGTTKYNVAPNLILADLWKWGLDFPRGVPEFTWSDAADPLQKASAWSNTDADFRGRTARPWGSGSAIGTHEVGTVAQETGSQITGGGANSLKMTGAGEVSFLVPVDAASTSITVLTKSTSYGGTNYPQLLVQPNAAIGVTAQTATASSASEQTLTATFTPTAKGVVEVRLVSRSSSVSSFTYFDTLAA